MMSFTKFLPTLMELAFLFGRGRTDVNINITEKLVWKYSRVEWERVTVRSSTLIR